ncbi:type II secretion system protein GspM [Vreelandella sp. EE22]
MRALTNRERQIAALSLLALLLWGAWTLLIELPFLAPLREVREDVATLQEQQQRYGAFLARSEGLEAALVESRNAPALNNRLLTGSDPNAVAANLMQLALDRIDERASQGPGCSVTQRMPIVPTQQEVEGGYRQVKVSLTLDCAIEPLASVLYAFEYGQPSLFVDQLNIQRDTSAPAAGGPGRLQVNLLLRGYLRDTQEPEGGA